VPLVLAALAVAAGIRIISLAPAFTEDLFAIGAGSNVVGVDTFSDRPAAARALPRVGGMRDVNTEAVIALHPDIVVGIPYEAARLADLARAGVRTEVLPLNDLHDDLAAIERLGVLSGHSAQARLLARTLRRRLEFLERQSQSPFGQGARDLVRQQSCDPDARDGGIDRRFGTSLAPADRVCFTRRNGQRRRRFVR